APDPDDFLCIHLWNAAAMVRQWFWGGRPAHTRLNRYRWNDRCLGYRDLPDPGNVLCHRAPLRRAKRKNATSENHDITAEGRACDQGLGASSPPETEFREFES